VVLSNQPKNPVEISFIVKADASQSVCLQLILKPAMLAPETRMRALAKFLSTIVACLTPALAQEPAAEPDIVDEPALPNSLPAIPHSPSTGLLPASGALPDPTPNLTSPIYSPIQTRNTVVSTSTVKPPLRPKTKVESKTQKRFEEVRSIAMRNPHVVNLLKRAGKASSSSARRNLMRAYYLAVCARMRLLEPGLKNSINAYQAEKTGKAVNLNDSTISGTKTRHSQKRSRHKETGTHSTRRKHTYPHRAIYPNDYELYGPYAPYGPYGY
jgi:hypothetical protein